MNEFSDHSPYPSISVSLTAMKPHLMYPDRDFDLEQTLPVNEQTLTQDLGLSTLFEAMSNGDKFLMSVSTCAVLSGLREGVGTILYRQAVLHDCLENSLVVERIYHIAFDVLRSVRSIRFLDGTYPRSVLYSALDLIRAFMKALEELRTLAWHHYERFESAGFRAFFELLQTELSDEYLYAINRTVTALDFRSGVLLGAGLTKEGHGGNYVLHKPPEVKATWLRRLLERRNTSYKIYIHPRNYAGERAQQEIRDRGIGRTASSIAQAAESIESFLTALKTELAFYMGCLNLYRQLSLKAVPVCFPVPSPCTERIHRATGLRDPHLALTLDGKVVGSDLNMGHKNLLIVTGANQGGKSTFLRSIGCAQLMMQCGMFVTAEAFRSNLCRGIFTHYRREEDRRMKSGKLDEELSRLSRVIDALTPDSLLLLNESFAATSEREGSEIAAQIARALLEIGIKTFFVTHLYSFAHQFWKSGRDSAFFLRAERTTDGGRTFRLTPGEPWQTSFGEDLYKKIFGDPLMAGGSSDNYSGNAAMSSVGPSGGER